MGVRYYLSGCADNDAFMGKLGDLLREDIPKLDRIVFIVGEPMNYGYSRVSAEWFVDQLAQAGMPFERYSVINYKTGHFRALNLIRNADMLFLMGGNPIEQKRMCKKLGIWNALCRYEGVMVGMSAGAMIMSKYIILPATSEEYPEFIIVDGMNRDNISIFPHNNTQDEDYPEQLYSDPELYHRDDLILAARLTEDFYLIQDFHGDEVAECTFIRGAEGDARLYSEDNGKAWIASEDGIHLCEELF